MTWRLLTLTLPRCSGRHPSIWRYCASVISITFLLTSQAKCQLVLTGPRGRLRPHFLPRDFFMRTPDVAAAVEGLDFCTGTAIFVATASTSRVLFSSSRTVSGMSI
jgi:hypothetical protein